MNEQLSLDSLTSDGYIIVNKGVLRGFGMNEAVLLGELSSKYKYWKEHNQLTEDGYFYATMEDLERETTLSPYAQRKAFKKLEELGMIKTKLMGIPPKKFFNLGSMECGE